MEGVEIDVQDYKLDELNRVIRDFGWNRGNLTRACSAGPDAGRRAGAVLPAYPQGRNRRRLGALSGSQSC